MDRKRSRINSSEASIGEVISNIDLLFEIFLRLPVISLIRFKQVSKNWLSLITDPQFGIAHSCRNTIGSPISDFYYQDHKRVLIISLDYHSIIPTLTCLDPLQQNDLSYNPEIMHSCKGLILLIQKRTWRPIVLNPTIQKYKLITPPFEDRRLLYRDTNNCDYLLAFEPLKSHHYKVVIFRAELCGGNWVHIFSSQSGLWKEITITSAQWMHSTRRIYWNGAIHWLNEKNIHMKFDVDTENMIENQLPQKPKILWSDKIEYFGESNGRLFLIQCRDSCALGFRMLEFDRDTLCWDIKHQVNLRPLVSQFPEMLSKFGCRYPGYSVLYVKSGDDMKSCSLVLAIYKKIVMYEVKKGKSPINATVVCELTDSISFSWLLQHRWFHPFIPCLAPV